jgi:hypothetical protein
MGVDDMKTEYSRYAVPIETYCENEKDVVHERKHER